MRDLLLQPLVFWGFLTTSIFWSFYITYFMQLFLFNLNCNSGLRYLVLWLRYHDKFILNGMYKRCNFTFEVTGGWWRCFRGKFTALKFCNRNFSGLFNWKGINLSFVSGLAIWYKEAQAVAVNSKHFYLTSVCCFRSRKSVMKLQTAGVALITFLVRSNDNDLVNNK